MKHFRKRINISFYSIVIAALLVPLTLHAAGRPSIDHLVGFFEEVVFGSELDKRLEALVVARWVDPLRISIKGQASPDHIKAVRHHLAALKKMTGITFDKVSPPDKPANLTLLFLPAIEMSKLKIKGVDPEIIKNAAAPLTCFFLTSKKPPDTIVWGIIVINVQRTLEAIDHCLLEELVQSLGLPNDTDMLRPSIFSDKDRLLELSRSDEILLRTLYDERMTEGLDRESALNVARRIIADWDQRLPPP